MFCVLSEFSLVTLAFNKPKASAKVKVKVNVKDKGTSSSFGLNSTFCMRAG